MKNSIIRKIKNKTKQNKTKQKSKKVMPPHFILLKKLCVGFQVRNNKAAEGFFI